MKSLTKYYNACEELTNEFVEKYFSDKDEPDYEPDVYWIGDEIGGCLHVNDEFLSMDDIVTAMKFKLKVDEYHDYYWWRSDWDDSKGEDCPLNMENYIRVYREDKSKLPKHK